MIVQCLIEAENHLELQVRQPAAAAATTPRHISADRRRRSAPQTRSSSRLPSICLISPLKAFCPLDCLPSSRCATMVMDFDIAMPPVQPRARGIRRRHGRCSRLKRATVSLAIFSSLAGSEAKSPASPGIFGQRQHMAERRPLADAACDQVGGLQREFRRGPAVGQRDEGRSIAPCRLLRPARAQASITRSR